MAEVYNIKVTELRSYCPKLKIGDKVLLTGTVYTARDAAHKRFDALMNEGKQLPVEIRDAVIYYAGPTPTPQNLPIGSCGPTTSSRMDPYSPYLYDLGVVATIGKGERNKAVIDSIIKNKGVYLCAIGGAGALAALSITDCQVIAFEDLGCESIKKLTFNEFPLIVGIDCNGNNIFNKD